MPTITTTLKLIAITTLTLGASLTAMANCADPVGVEGDMIYNSSAKMAQFCDGTVWVNMAGVAPSAGGGGGGGGPSYAGVTSSTVDGDDEGSLAAMDALCASEYSGSRMMRATDYKYISADITSATEAWVQCDSIVQDGNNTSCASLGGKRQGNYYYPNCTGWTATASYNYGHTLKNSGETIRACSSSYAVHCVTD